ncbi:ammonia-forming cytochrome c nitrite reductase subunit c552 [Marinicella rhabdoformis]|uniref:ammonia-forming cytochrome c nitrite reductase subunit c552 n=1 Tax=Marinicella rhabdoformis TaxID=2580566 RepID=UPI0015CFFA28|nr:ammonia-forming cytochrome c nitrite reductase subunit c552 [Marinicella rhabdoformis]
MLATATFYAWHVTGKAVDQKVDFHQGDYTGSDTCQDCHQDRYDSWHRTYHRTMTQETSPETVLGDFNGKPQTYWGYTIKPIKRNNRYYFAYHDGTTGAFLSEVEIVRTVGSRRYQQYMAQTEATQGNYYRLELLWHIEDQRWIHLNGAFLGSDQQSFSAHTGIWNQNCIFCHNTGITPGMSNYNELANRSRSGEAVDVSIDALFQSEVTELGIGCESCHSPAATHSELSSQIMRKYYLGLTDARDPSVVNPNHVDQQASLSICGQCHGQRTPETLALAKVWMEEGPTFRPGDDLETHVNPVWQDSQVDTQQHDLFKSRFWADGTARLTAYEYQGIVQSACTQDPTFTCQSCHTMHGGDVKGMIEPENRTNQACASCHLDLVTDPSPHTGHKPDSPGSLCYDCHMPKMSYGIMTFHRNHRIESPQTENELSISKPNACVACHLNKTDDWLINETQAFWDQKSAPYQPHHMIQSLVELHSGDPVQRAVAAYQMGHHFESLSAKNRLFLLPHLLLGLQDNYPAIRRFSYKSLNQILSATQNEHPELQVLSEHLVSFDFIGNTEQRAPFYKNTMNWLNHVDTKNWPTPPEGSMLKSNYQIDWEMITPLRNQALTTDKVIHIGE